MISSFFLEFGVVCFAVGMSGAAVGAWLCSRSHGAQLEAQRKAFELAREKAERDVQRALSCVPQWVQQAVRVEFGFLGLQQKERWNEWVDEQQRWRSSERAAPRGTERQPQGAVLPHLHPRGPAAARPQPASEPDAPPLARGREPGKPLAPSAAPMAARPSSERELTDEEIDALPPDLPAPAPSRGRKLPSPKAPVLRNI